MNYRHIYHAGNACDVVKHAAFTLLLEKMKGKDKPFAVLDTHAGCGLYDLADERAQKTGEAEAGILRLWSQREKAPPHLKPYFDALTALSPRHEIPLPPLWFSGREGLVPQETKLRFYPGSPLIALKLLRPQDRLIACELHPEDVNDLRRTLHGDPRVQMHHRDGYEALRAFLPFPEKRGLILIDPPFEEPNEIDNLAAAAKLAQTRMRGVVLAIWYPIKDRPAIWRLHEALRDANLPETLIAEFLFHPETRADRLNGTGLVIVNPPWPLANELRDLFPHLHTLLGTAGEGRVDLL